MNTAKDSGFIALAVTPHVVVTALKLSFLVGTILALINHGDKLLSMSLSASDSLKITLTYLVPYCVSTWSAVQALKAKNG